MNIFKHTSRTEILQETRDYLMITFGLIFYAIGWTVFLIPNQIATGGVIGISAIIYYSTGLPLQISNLLINAVLLVGAVKLLGWKFSIKTSYAIIALTLFLWWFQQLVGGVSVIGDEPFMACVLGAACCGAGLGIVYINNGSTGGTDIIAAVVTKFRDVTFGRMILYCDIIIITSCYFIFHDWKKVVFGFVTLIVITYVLDLIINSARQSVQFFIFSKEHEEISRRINSELNRGVTIIDGTGFYSQAPVKIIFVLAKKSQSVPIFRLVKEVDPNAFVSQSAAIGVYGQGFDRIKVK